MKKFLELSSWRTALGNLLPSAHGHQGGSRKAAIGSMLVMAFAFVGCDDSSSASAGQNDEPGVESSSSSSGKVTEPAEVTSSSSEKAKSSSSDAQSDAKQSSSSEKSGMSSCSTDDASSSSVKLRSSSSVETPNSSSSELSESSSSSADEVESSSSSVIGCKTETEDNCEYGELIDDRDGQIYKTVKIGDQWWMAENLNYGDSIKTPSLKGKSWCYGDVAANCDVAGRLYTWAAAIDSVKLATDAENPLDCGYVKTCGLSGKVQGICPSGWHLPSKSEWNTLFTKVGGSSTAGTKLKSQSGWYSRYNNGNGDDAFGFSALPAGYYSLGYFDNDGDNAYFWSSTEIDSIFAYFMYLDYYDDDAHLYSYDKDDGFSVRCLRD